jgi:hypothetical protein
MPNLRAFCAGGLLVSLLALAGCGDHMTGEVSGTVTLGGTPVQAGAITFIPVDGKTGTAGGAIKEGRYSARVPVGLMKVSISVPKVVRMKKLYNTPNSPEMPWTDESAPARYNAKTELRFEVAPGANEKDFALERK